MHKIKLKPKYNYTIPTGAMDYGDLVRNHTMYRLLTDEQIEWLFENTKDRFCMDGEFIFFENINDALAFKLRWL